MVDGSGNVGRVWDGLGCYWGWDVWVTVFIVGMLSMSSMIFWDGTVETADTLECEIEGRTI